MIGQTWTAIQTSLGAAISRRHSLLAEHARREQRLLHARRTRWRVREGGVADDPVSDESRRPTRTLSTAIQTAIWAIASNQPRQRVHDDLLA